VRVVQPMFVISAQQVAKACSLLAVLVVLSRLERHYFRRAPPRALEDEDCALSECGADGLPSSSYAG
jgi:hypothetical protein